MKDEERGFESFRDARRRLLVAQCIILAIAIGLMTAYAFTSAALDGKVDE
jgi:hypothetical protein